MLLLHHETLNTNPTNMAFYVPPTLDHKGRIAFFNEKAVSFCEEVKSATTDEDKYLLVHELVEMCEELNENAENEMNSIISWKEILEKELGECDTLEKVNKFLERSKIINKKQVIFSSEVVDENMHFIMTVADCLEFISDEISQNLSKLRSDVDGSSICADVFSSSVRIFIMAAEDKKKQFEAQNRVEEGMVIPETPMVPSPYTSIEA